MIYDREHHLIAFSWNVFFLRFGDLYRVKAEKKVVKNALLEIRNTTTAVVSKIKRSFIILLVPADLTFPSRFKYTKPFSLLRLL